MESQVEKQEHSDGEKEEDVGITFVARKVETPKQRPKSGGCQQVPGHTPSRFLTWGPATFCGSCCNSQIIVPVGHQCQLLWKGVQVRRQTPPHHPVQTATCHGRAAWEPRPLVSQWRLQRSFQWTCSRPGTRASPPLRASPLPLSLLSLSTHGSAHLADWEEPGPPPTPRRAAPLPL